jgi:RND family efflux transporter MFP subunit
MSKKSLLILPLAAVFMLAGCGESAPEKPVARVAPAAGRLPVVERTIADLKPVPATLTTRDMGEARARITGVLVSLLVKEGDVVRKGQVIATVKDDRLALLTAAYDAQVAAAAADAARAQADLTRTRTLFAQGIYAQARLDQVEAIAKASSASLAAARAQRSASVELGAQGAILAPASGRVLVADVPPGSVVTAGQSVARITAGPAVVRLELPEGQARTLRLGDAVQVSIDGAETAATGIISQIYPSVVAGQVVADVTAAGLPQDLVGQRATVMVRVGERQAVVVPRRYVSTRYGVDYARLVRSDGAASDTPVQTRAGPTSDELEILSGLKAGDVLSLPEAVR